MYQHLHLWLPTVRTPLEVFQTFKRLPKALEVSKYHSPSSSLELEFQLYFSVREYQGRKIAGQFTNILFRLVHDIMSGEGGTSNRVLLTWHRLEDNLFVPRCPDRAGQPRLERNVEPHVMFLDDRYQPRRMRKST